MSKVLATGPRIPVAVTAAVAVFLHVGMAAGATAASLFDEIFEWHRGVREVVDYRLSQYEMEILKEEEPPPPEPEEEAKPEPEEAKPEVKDPTPPPEAAPPQPAEAAKVLTADPTPSEGPVDLTDSFVTGSGSTYAGGTTSSDGTSKTAVYNPAAAPTGVPGGTGTGTAPPAPVRREDKSRAPGLLGSVDWNDCPFPAEADAEQIDQAFVLIQVKVKPDGSPDNVSVVQDPGHGFGREARKCAMRKKYSNGLDPDGNAVGGTTKPFRVRFER
ncbi:MAG: energy transducer TonB [Labilithrix sp.]|nr:energy transducer TonB [Labilithrix sp.]